MLIGLDLDNTIIDYGTVFGSVGVDLGLCPESLRGASKSEVKAWLVAREGGERDWMWLQGQVYGTHIGRAALYRGVKEFFSHAREKGIGIAIVSHKTRYGHFDERRMDLWEAALQWLTDRGFFASQAFDLPRERVFFEETREGKIARIRSLGCDLFVDDLVEVLLHPDFPASTKPVWFAGRHPPSDGHGLHPYRSWDEITRSLAEAAV